MIWNSIKQFLWCGVFHKTEMVWEKGNNVSYCAKCGATFEVI